MNEQLKLIKWRTVQSPDRVARITDRLEHIRLEPPRFVPRLLSHGWLQDGRLRLEIERVKGFPLKNLTPPCTTSFRMAARFALDSWRESNFVHGDLSPRNILFDGESETLKFWFIDWIIDLESFEGTPRYTSPNAFKGRRSHDSDLYAMHTILQSDLKA